MSAPIITYTLLLLFQCTTSNNAALTTTLVTITKNSRAYWELKKSPAMDARHLKDPAAGLPQQLLPHLHLVSKHRYPMLTNPNIEQIVNYLIEAPKVMREVSPVQWQFLDGPQDGSMFLVWQPLEMQTSFASDGYVWSDAEASFNSEVRGFSVQMLWHRAGYKPNAEQVATHSRKRWRLVPNNQMQMGNPDPCLWLIHYSKAQTRDQHPASSLPVAPHVAQSFQQRAAIARGGQLPRKDFMLHDRSSWPIINLPASVARVAAPAGQLPPGHRRGGSLQEHQATLEEEEDVSRGDALDFMTPRDISRMRYEQHHEWMEEILESHYASMHIVPSDLGLGRKGPLESLTNGFFTAPTTTVHEPMNGKVGKLPPGKSDEFTKQAEQKLVEMQAELDKMKQDHARRMEKLKRTTVLGHAERKLRNMNTADDSYKAIGAKVQELVGKKIEPVQHISLVSRGGMQDIKPIITSPQRTFQHNQAGMPQYPSQAAQNQQQRQPQQSQTQANSQVQTQTQTSAQQQQQQPQQIQAQQQTQPPLPTQAQNEQQPSPVRQPQHQTLGQAKEPEERNTAITSAETTADTQTSQTQQMSDPQPNPDTPITPMENNDAISTGNDLDLDESGDQDLMTGDENNDGGDWDMLTDQPGDNETPAEEEINDQQASTNQQTATTLQRGNQSNNNTPGGETNDFDMVTDFDTNMDTAGDALADYGGADDDLNLEESAFGDAFHSHEQDME